MTRNLEPPDEQASGPPRKDRWMTLIRRGRKKKHRKRRRIILTVAPLPTLLTVGNMLCGFGAICLALWAMNIPEERKVQLFGHWFHVRDMSFRDLLFLAAGWMIFAGMAFDFLDGKVARWADARTRFGAEMDSLADVVSFGLAPPIIVVAMILSMWGVEPHGPRFAGHEVGGLMQLRFVWPLSGIYLACSGLRLARFNVESAGRDEAWFHGLPSPAAAAAAMSIVVFRFSSEGQFLGKWFLLIVPSYMAILGLLMITRIPYLKLSESFLKDRVSIPYLVAFVLAVILLILAAKIVLLVVCNAYVVFGLAGAVVRYCRHPRQEASAPEGTPPLVHREPLPPEDPATPV